MNSEKGFALVAALLSMMVLLSVGILAFTVSTKDVQISSRIVGDKIAFSAAEAGLNELLRQFQPGDTSYVESLQNASVAPADAYSRYTVNAPTVPTNGPVAIPYQGFSIGGEEVWGQLRYLTEVQGSSTRFISNIRISAGIGWGPADITTMYR